MVNKHFLIVFHRSHLPPQPVLAARIEAHGDHLVLLDCEGRLAALFLLENVESWHEIEADLGAIEI